LIERLKELKYKYLLLLLFLIIINSGAYLLYKNYNLNNTYFFIILGSIDIILIFQIIYTRKIFMKNIHNIIKEIASKYNSDYFPDKVISEYYYLQIEDDDYDYYEGSDYTKGENFEFSYVKTTKEEEYEDDEGNTYTETKTVYEGTIYWCEFFYKTENIYYLEPSSFHLSDILPIGFDKTRIKLDYPDFEKIFDVYGSDQIEGRMIFNHNFMNNLIKIYKVLGSFKMIIKNDKCILSFENTSPIPVSLITFNKQNLLYAEKIYIFFLEMHKFFDDKKLIV